MRLTCGTVTLAVSIMFVPSMVAQSASIEGIAASSNRIEGAYRNTAGMSARALSPRTPVLQTDKIFPHIAAGDGWETAIVIVNMSVSTVPFTQQFYDDAGAPMQVTLRRASDGTTLTTSAIQGSLPMGASISFTVCGSTTLQTGWSYLDYDSTSARLGGYASFRLKSGSVTNEGLVPLSAYDDYEFMMPFDNANGFATGFALCNPASNLMNQVTILALDLNGNLISQASIVVPPGGHSSFVLTSHMPELAGLTGTLLVDSSINRLSAVGIRMNVAGGSTFTSIPIMN